MNVPAHNSRRVDKRKVRENFDRAAPRYDEIAILQRSIGDLLLTHLDPAPSPEGDAVVLDMGVGTGYCLAPLAERYPDARIVALDIADGMLKAARNRNSASKEALFVCGDAEHLPFKNDCVDVVFSNVTVQWCNEFALACQEFARIMRPGGLMAFSTFGPDTLWELRDSWNRADRANDDTVSHVNEFVDMHDIGDILVKVGFTDVVMDREEVVCTYDRVQDLMRELKTLGAHNATPERARSLTGKERFQAMLGAYESHRRNGDIPATYEVIYAFGKLP